MGFTALFHSFPTIFFFQKKLKRSTFSRCVYRTEEGPVNTQAAGTLCRWRQKNNAWPSFFLLLNYSLGEKLEYTRAQISKRNLSSW